MKSLKTLIKLHKTHLDNIITQINHLQNEKNKFENLLEESKKKVESELVLYTNSEYAFIIDEFLKNSRKQQKAFNDNIIQINKKIDTLNSELTKQYSELKKFEIALENKLKKEVDEEKKLENKQIDELNIIKH